MGHVFQGGEIGWRVIGAEAALIVAEHHVHPPIQAVFDGPMAADDGTDLVGEPHERGHGEAGFAFGFVTDFTHGDQRLCAFLLMGPTHGLAVDGDHFRRNAGRGGDPSHETALKLLRIERGEDIPK